MAAKYNPRKEHNLKRRTCFRPVKKTFLIVCEGLNTEPEYFNAFRLTSAVVKAVGKGLGTLSLVKEAVSLRKRELRGGRTFDFCWVVFDKDDYADFDEAIWFAEKNGFNAAYSNQAFELWFLLHFKRYGGPLQRSRYAELLGKHLGFPYSKRAGFVASLYQILKPVQNAAIANTETLEKEKKGIPPSAAESLTTVHQLVKSLNEYADE